MLASYQRFSLYDGFFRDFAASLGFPAPAALAYIPLAAMQCALVFLESVPIVLDHRLRELIDGFHVGANGVVEFFVAGWVDRFEANGRRYFVVARCSPEETHPRVLSKREGEVILHAIRGEIHKRIAYRIGLSRSSVTKLLRSALGKLRLRSQAQLVSEFLCFVQLARFMEPDSLAARVALTARRKGRSGP